MTHKTKMESGDGVEIGHIEKKKNQ